MARTAKSATRLTDLIGLGVLTQYIPLKKGRGGSGGDRPPKPAPEAVTGAGDDVLRVGPGPVHGGWLWRGAALPGRGSGAVGSARPAFTPERPFEHLAGPPAVGS